MTASVAIPDSRGPDAHAFAGLAKAPRCRTLAYDPRGRCDGELVEQDMAVGADDAARLIDTAGGVCARLQRRRADRPRARRASSRSRARAGRPRVACIEPSPIATT